MYKTFLSFEQMRMFLPMLVEKGLLEYESDNNTYKTTAKGMHFLKVYNNLEQYFPRPPMEASVL